MEQFPSFFEQLKNNSEPIKVPICKLELSSQSVQDERWSICETCNHNRGGRCEVCGCGLEYLIKRSSSMCPIMKWNHS